MAPEPRTEEAPKPACSAAAADPIVGVVVEPGLIFGRDIIITCKII